MAKDRDIISVGMDASDLVSGVKVVEILAKKYNLAMESMAIASVDYTGSGRTLTATFNAMTLAGDKFTAKLRNYGQQFGVDAIKITEGARKLSTALVACSKVASEAWITPSNALVVFRQKAVSEFEKIDGAHQRMIARLIARNALMAQSFARTRTRAPYGAIGEDPIEGQFTSRINPRIGYQQGRLPNYVYQGPGAPFNGPPQGPPLPPLSSYYNNRFNGGWGGAPPGGGGAGGLPNSFGFFGNLFLIQSAHRAFSAYMAEIRNGVKDASEFLIRIGEIRTISQNAPLEFDKWARGVKQLSDEFGNPLLDTAKATYQTLSNQVAEGAESFDFMRSAARFGLASVTDMSTSVDLLSSALNGFNLSATESERVSAILFKGIEVGRFTAKDLSNSFGQVSKLAHDLGISIEDVVTSLAILTRAGISPDEAMTQLTGVMNGLLKPSKELKKTYDELGVASGSQLIATFGGLQGALVQIKDKTKDTDDELSKFFLNIRGRKGATGLLDPAQFAKDKAEIVNGLQNYDTAVTEILNNPGKKFQIEMNKVKNFFIADFGVEIINRANSISEALGIKLSDGIIGSTKAITGLAVGLASVIALIGAARLAAIGFNLAMTPWIGIPVAIGAITLGLISMRTTLYDVEKAASDAGNAFQKLHDVEFIAFQQDSARRTQAFEDGLNDQFQLFQLYASAIAKANDELTNKLIEQDANASKLFKKTLQSVSAEINKSVTSLESEINRLQAKADKAQNKFEDLVQRNAARKFDTELAGVANDPKARFDLIAGRVKSLQDEANRFAGQDAEQSAKLLEEAARLLESAKTQFEQDLRAGQRVLDKADPEEKRERIRLRNRHRGANAADFNKAIANQEREQANAEKLAKNHAADLAATQKQAEAKARILEIEKLQAILQEGQEKIANRQLQEADKAKHEAEELLATRRAGLDQVRETLAVIERINAKKGISDADFNDFLKAANVLKEQTDKFLSPEDQLKLLADVDAKKARLSEILNGQRISKEQAALKRELEEKKKLVLQAEKEKEEALSKLKQSAQSKGKNIAEALGSLDALGLLKDLEGQDPSKVLNGPQLQAFNDLKAADERLRGALNDFTLNPSKFLLDALEEAVDKFFSAQEVFRKQPNLQNQAGVRPLVDGVNIEAKALVEMQKAIRDLREDVGKNDGLQQQIDEINVGLEKIKAEAQTLPDAIKEAAGLSGQALDENLGTSLDAIITRIQVIKQLLNENADVNAQRGVAPFDPLGPNAAPGVGADFGARAVPGRGGVVARAFAPLLESIGSGAAVRAAVAGNTTSFGNINVTVNAAGGQISGREIAHAIERHLRLQRA